MATTNATTTTAPVSTTATTTTVKVKNGKKPTTGGKKKNGKKPTPAPVVNPNGNRGNPTAEPVANVAKRPAKFVSLTSTAAAGVATKATIHGHSACAVLRQLGCELYPAFTPAVAAVLVAKLGIPLRKPTLQCQVGSGRQVAVNGGEGHHGKVAKVLNATQVKELAKLAGL